MLDTIRDAPFGQLVRLLTRNRVFQYPEERPSFKCPHSYQEGAEHHQHEHHDLAPINEEVRNVVEGPKEGLGGSTGVSLSDPDTSQLQTIATAQSQLEKLDSNSSNTSASSGVQRVATLTLQRTHTLPYTEERLVEERAIALEKTRSTPIAPSKTADGITLVDW